MRSRWIATLLVILLLIPGVMLAEEEKVLNLFTWELYIDEETVLTPFTEATGIRVNYTNFSSNEEMLAKLEIMDGSMYDLVLASDYALDILRSNGLLLELDRALLTNWDNIDPVFQGQYYDPDDLYTIPYAAGTPLIVYDPQYVDCEMTGYDSLWDPSLRDSVVVMDDARNVIGITLKTLGQSFNVRDPAILAEAREKLLTLKPNIRALDYDTPHLLLISGEATVGYMFTPQAIWALDERPDLELVYPKEGMGFGIDCLVIPVRAPHPGNAHTFLNFLLQPEIGAEIAVLQNYLNCNRAATPLIPEEYGSNPALYIPPEILGEVEFIQDVGEATALFDLIWTAFKQE